MLRTFARFVRGVSADAVGRIGVALTTSSFLVFGFIQVLMLLGLVTNAYVGLVIYLTLPALFVLGLLLVPLGWLRLKRRTGLGHRELLSARFETDMLAGRFLGSRLFLTVAGLTLVNLTFLGVGSARMLHFMDTPVFCGTACHSVMGPEWATYQASPHAHVPCVACHVGEGMGALIDSKINGAWQVVSLSFDLYERPIPTPVHQLHPARETCETCHWPDKFYGERVLGRTRFDLDDASSRRYTTLAMKVGSGREGIHWHVAAGNAVRYASVDDEREQILFTEVLQPDGSWRRYDNRRLDGPDPPAEALRTLDCVDCHNRATHVYASPEALVDEALARGEIDPSIPEIKRTALAALTGAYPGSGGADRGIERDLHGHYQRHHAADYPALAPRLDAAVDVLQAAHRRYVHPRMNVGWDPYPDHLGHRGDTGCARCHHRDMVDQDGVAVSHECTQCHHILAWESPGPFQYLLPLEEGDPEMELHRSLQAEFVGVVPRLQTETRSVGTLQDSVE
ncbi:MAG: cytochrome C [Deltaproteobacteria bacterium]|nr:cytochrome C [Deltaproteobacteria bacterium]